MTTKLCLNKLSEYCEKWDVSVNVLKTKVMIMSAGNDFVKYIKFNSDILECVSTSKYLEHDRVWKAKKASFPIHKALSTTQNVSVNLALSHFDKQIEPILLYGCPIWGFPPSNCPIRLKYDQLDI